MANHTQNQHPLDSIFQIEYDTPTSAKSDDEIGVSYIKSGISTHPVRKGVCFYARSLPTPCACLMVGCAGEQQCSPFLLSGTPILHNPSPFRLASFGDGNDHYQENQTMKALSFNGVTLTPVHHNSQIYLTSAELAKALGYSSLKSVNNLYNANADEFSDDMTTVINSMTVRKTGAVNLSVRIFSLRGCHLIAMFARTPVAKEFRKWVLDILDKEVGKPVMTAPIAASPRLSPADYTAIKQAVHHISFGMKFYDAAIHAIYARLRQLCEVSSVADLRYEHLSIIQNELYRIDRTLTPYKKMRSETEKQLIRRICGEDELAVSAAILDIESTATAYAKEGDKWLHATAEIKRIGQVGGAM